MLLQSVRKCYKRVKCCYKVIQSVTTVSIVDKVLQIAPKVSNVVTKCYKSVKCCYKYYKSVKCCYKVLQKSQMLLKVNQSVTKVSNVVTKCCKTLYNNI